MNKFIIKTEEEFNIIYNSYRMKIITEFSLCENMTATFKYIADKLGDNSSKVTYHGKMLIKIGLLELAYTKSINGITAKYYKLKTDSFSIKYGEHDDEVVKKKVMKHKATIILDSLVEMEEIIRNLDNEKRSIVMASNEIYLTKEELNELKELITTYASKNKHNKGTKKVTFYSLLIDENKDEIIKK